MTAWANDRKGPMQASASFGECENIPAAEPAIGVDGLEGPGDAVLKQAVIEGRTLFVSTGDTALRARSSRRARTAWRPGVPALNYPSASPYAVAVGGTVLNSDGGNPPKRFSETAWEYGGGGDSTNEVADSTSKVSRRCTASPIRAAIRTCLAPLLCAARRPTSPRSRATLQQGTGC